VYPPQLLVPLELLRRLTVCTQAIRFDSAELVR
jgi:hypothetical protein